MIDDETFSSVLCGESHKIHISLFGIYSSMVIVYREGRGKDSGG